MTAWFTPPRSGPDGVSRQPRPEWTAALGEAGRAEVAARDSGDDDALAASLYARGCALNRLGQSQEALGALLECVAFLPAGRQREQALAWREAACAQRNLACDTEALEYLGLALRLAQESADPALEVDLIEDLAQAHAEQEDHGAALHALHGSLRVRRTLPGQPGLAHTLVRLAQVQLRACAAPDPDLPGSTPPGPPLADSCLPDPFLDGQLREAHATLLEALRLLGGPALTPEHFSAEHFSPEHFSTVHFSAAHPARDSNDRVGGQGVGGQGALRGEALAALAHLHLRRGDPAAAQRSALEALEWLRRAGATRQALRVLPDLARAQLALGEAAAALAGLREALAVNTPERLLAEQAALHLAACEACEALGDHAGALGHHRAFHALDSRGRGRHDRERLRATQARVGLDATREEARLHRVRGEELEAEVQARTAQLARSQRAVIDLLASCAEFRDAPLGPHTRWVGDAAQAVALALGSAPAEAAQLGLAARLHDVGKIGIPDSVLLKRGPLLPDEWAQMAEHTTLGARLLTQPGAADGGPLLQLAAQIALTHHECWDGSGYPAGLTGEAIPLGGRIVRVVDTFDALVSARPYKDGWPAAQALSYLSEHAGQLFDPVVVRVFAELHAAGRLPERA
ncbi:hypothetical protein GCM10008959_27210 [Deinococcus seoulensis]|uniref:HD-GYP domain-containing protein n=1 Tax=Deinococcus seoulensis TaxID=1837379 RepID=A0ABQ2RWG2_9DEIO|nr:HD domain-containing phosphohydrolase [Deinococcus seoulensis]GGR63598.1 hypothetical protein GCM10008959_27210 [Deinococcus seoulensis]